MAKGDWWLKFEIHKWLNDPKVRRLSRANRDSWLTALCMMRLDGTDRIEGTQVQLSQLLGLTLTEFYEFFHDLEDSNAADVTRCHALSQNCPEVFTVISRRFRKELTTKEQNRLRKQKHREEANVTAKSRDRVISKKKVVRKDVGEAANAGNKKSPKSSSTSKPSSSDPRSSHAAIQAFRTVCGRYPSIELYDRIIQRFGETVNTEKLSACWLEWVECGYNKNSVKWLNWYFDGIPVRDHKNIQLSATQSVPVVEQTQEERAILFAKQARTDRPYPQIG